MIDRKLVDEQLKYTLQTLKLPQLGEPYVGKVRDSYVVGDRRILITTDRLSAFDRVLTTIPFKGQLLNSMAAYWFKKTEQIVPNHLLAVPHPNVSVTQEVEILPVEVVVRGYLAGSAWRDYQAGKAVSGITLPTGLKKSQQLPEPIITPSTKAEHGKHDEAISSADIVRSGLVAEKLWAEVCEKTFALFQFGSSLALKRGLILVDTKYEFGLLTTNGKSKLVLADELHTQDSSRYWIAESYQERLEAGQDPIELDKEFIRRWLLERGFSGDGNAPEIPDSLRVDLALRYIEAFEKNTGLNFEPHVGSAAEEITTAVNDYLSR